MAHLQQWWLPLPLHKLCSFEGKFDYLAPSLMCPQRGDIHLDKLQFQDKDGSLHRILSGLDVLGQTSWRINNPILSVVEEIRQNESESANLEPLLHPSPSTIPDPFLPDSLAQPTPWEQNLKIEIAKLFSNSIFYLPHSLDFRGRAYPIAPHLSVVGDDLSRALLSYGQGKKLGPRGWYWLRVHLANAAGYSKGKTYQERVDFADAHLVEILDSANNPLTGQQWWRKCGTTTPWQCLAACIEIRDALNCSSPTEFVSFLPVSQVTTPPPPRLLLGSI